MTLAFISLPERGATDALLAEVAGRLQTCRVRLAGTVQTNTERDCTHACDMDLRVLPDGPLIRINQNLGAGSTGCRLDPGALEAAVAAVAARLDEADMLIVNKFGKHEAEGRGFRAVIAEALMRGLPVLVGVNALSRAAFDAYAGDFAVALRPDVEAVCLWAARVLPEAVL